MYPMRKKTRKQSYCPTEHSNSSTIPIHKGGLTMDIGNYRPISLLSVFDKIIEKLMHKRLYNFLEEHNILFCNQFGFRKTIQPL